MHQQNSLDARNINFQKNVIESVTLGIASPWAHSSETVLKSLHVTPQEGLTSFEVQQRLKIYGKNQLKAENKIGWISRLLAQFKSPVVLVLLGATLISIFVGELVDATAIIVIVVINAFIGFIQESKSEEAVNALKKLAVPKVRVLRDKTTIEVDAIEISLGDILVFEAGDYIAADARIITANQFFTNEALLTGESLPVGKIVDPVSDQSLLGDRYNMLYAGTSISGGTARAVVTATAMNTEIGKIAGLLDVSKKEETPLQIRLAQVSQKLLIFCGAVVLVVALLGVIHGEKAIDVLMVAISLAVAAIPEGLPTVVTLALALSIRRMAQKMRLSVTYLQ